MAIRKPWLCTLILAAATTGAVAAPDRSELRNVGIPALKQAYLECERAAAEALFDTASAAACSAIHEELKVRAFDSDWSRMAAWWRSARREGGER